MAPTSALREQGNVRNGTNKAHNRSGLSRCDSNPPTQSLGVVATDASLIYRGDTAEDSSSSTVEGQEVQDETVDVEEVSFLPRLADVGLPPDGV